MERAALSQALCMTCGLCCDGTLFGKVLVQETDAVAPLQVGGIEIQAGGGTRQNFKQPCAAFQQGCCQVYADRPANCRKYRCELLKKHEAGTVSWADAQQRIRSARMLREAIDDEFARILPGSERMSLSAVLKLIPGPAELTAHRDLQKRWAPVTMPLSALLDCLRTHFRSPHIDEDSHQ